MCYPLRVNQPFANKQTKKLLLTTHRVALELQIAVLYLLKKQRIGEL